MPPVPPVPMSMATFPMAIQKGEGKPHIRSVCWGVLVREDTCPRQSAKPGKQLCEVGQPVPFLAASIPPVFPPVPYL